MQINPSASSLAGLPPLPASHGPAEARGGSGVPFSQLMSQFLHEVDRPQQAVIQGMDELMAGKSDNIHEIAINVAQADVSFRLAMEVRDQLIKAYQEVMRMQV
ncbi:flagellar hook-basal body complex protein FliE [Planctomicrobium sp. SH664]|uniref:flagellar hook-basal body complex protein FliE n=1 Tax=Planctomicrobium sp. SH664 TaxID=3448125 RepID=UPI003F5C99BD